MSQTIKLKRGTTTPTTSNLVSGEVAIDTSAKKLYINDAGTIKEIGGGLNTISASDVPNLPASKITSGTFATARIPNLAASKITSGTFDAARIPTLSQYIRSDANDTTTGNITIQKTTPRILLKDSNGSTGTYPEIEFETNNNQGVKLYHNEFDGELPATGYGLVLAESDTNTQFPTTGTLSFNVLGEMYAGGTTLSSLNKVFHDGYHPNADKWTTARSHTVTLTGDVTGTASQNVDGTGNKTWSLATSLSDTYLTSYTETDTLATVTGRGSTTTAAINTGGYKTGNVTRIDATGNMFPTSIQMGAGTVVIDASRNVSNVGTITSGGKLKVKQAGTGTSNSESPVAAFSGQNQGGAVDALSLINSVSGATGNSVGIDFHNASNWSATGRISTIQTNGTQSKIVFKTYNSGLHTALTLDSDKTATFGNHVIASGNLITATSSSTLGIYAGSTQIFEGSTRNLKNIGTISAGSTTISGQLTFTSNLNLGSGLTRLVWGWGASSGSSLRNYLAPRNDADDAWNYSHEFGYDHNVNSWYIDDQLHLGYRLTHKDDTDTYLEFQTNNIKLVAGGVVKFNSANTYLQSESDTLDSVTNRGNTTTNGISVSSLRMNSTEVINSSRHVKPTQYHGQNFVRTGTTTGDIHQMYGVVMGHQPESGHMTHPFFYNDLGNFEARGGTVTIGGLSYSPSMTNAFKAHGDSASWNNSSYSGSTMTITLTNLPRTLNYGGFIGISFGNSSWTPASLKIEISTDGGSTWTTRLNDSSTKTIYFTSTGTGGTGLNAIRFTIGQAVNTTSIRVTNIWAYNYNSKGMHNYFIDKAGDTLHGELSFNDANTKLLEGVNNRIKVQTNHGYVEVGAGDASYAHFITDRPSYYFDKEIKVDTGVVGSYDEDLVLRRAGNTSDQITLGTSGVTFASNYSLSSGVITAEGTSGGENLDYASNFAASSAGIQLTLERKTDAAGWGGIGADSSHCFSAWGGSGGVTRRFAIGQSGSANLLYGDYQINGTTVIDSSRNATNIGSVSAAGQIYTTVADKAFWANNSSTYVQVGPNSGGAAGTFGAHRLTTNSGLDYTTYIGYDCYYSDTTQKWKALRTNLGRKWKTNFGGYHQNRFTISTYDGGGTSGSSLSAGWLEADWEEKFGVSATGVVDIANSLRIGTTTVIDSSRNLTNIGTISSGAITATGSSYFGSTGSNNDQYIRGNTNVGLRIQANAQGTGGTDGMRVGINDVHAFVWQFENKPLSFGTNNTQKATILQNGNMGINVTSPSVKLDVNGDAGFSQKVGIGTTTFTNALNSRALVIGSAFMGSSASLFVDGFSRFKGDLNLSKPSSPGSYFGISYANEKLTLTKAGSALAAIDASDGYYVGTTQIINSSRSLTNIGTISSGAITSSGNMSLTGELDITKSTSLHSLIFGNRDDFADSSDDSLIWITSGNGTFKNGQGAHLVFEGRKDNRNFYFKVGNVTAPQHIMHSNGHVGFGIGDIVPTDRVHVDGTLRADSYKIGVNTVISSGRELQNIVKLKTNDGTATAPSHTFTSDTNTGMFSGGADVLKLTAGGVTGITINSDTVALIRDNVNVKDYLRHYGDTDTHFRFTTDRIRMVAGNVTFIDAVEGTTDYLRFPTRAVTIGNNTAPNACLTIEQNSTTTPADGGGSAGEAHLRIDNANTTASASSVIAFNADDAGGNTRHGAGIQFKKASNWGNASGSYPGELYFWTRPSSGNQVAAQKIDKDGNAIFKGNVTAYGSLSDRRLKENIEPIADAVAKVEQLEGVTFNYKKDGKRSTGLIAQDLEAVLKEAVYTTEDIETGEEHKAIHYGNTVGLLVNAIKEQQQTINQLAKRIEDLENGNH